MDDIKNTFLKFAVILLILVIPVSLFTAAIEWTMNAIRWIVFLDNAETGLPMPAEMIVKGICEAIITAIAIGFGISKKSPLVSILSILFGFVVCIGIYAICKYIIWIAAGLAVLFSILLLVSILQKKKETEKKENAVL